MNDILLAKPTLPPDFTDLSVGEPYIIREKLYKIFEHYGVSTFGNGLAIEDFEYQKPNGYGPLVKFLENEYQAPVIITNGAKQSVGALLYAVKKSGGTNIGLRNPYWALFKPLIEMHGLCQVEDIHNSDAYLLVHPNNPDGHMYDEHTLNYYTDYCREAKKPLIHDAAYYSHVYLPQDYEIKRIGDVQVFTFSKLFGLSGLRIGYSVFYNTQLYKHALEYMEHMTVGVSISAQKYAHDLLVCMKHYEKKSAQFEKESYLLLQKNKELVSKINPAIMDTSHIISTPGMFAWSRCYDLEAFKKAKLNVLEGTPFGMPGYVRLNLALHNSVMKDVLDRLNKVK